MIASITVTYQPDMGLLKKQLGSLQGQVQQIIVIDNGTTKVSSDELRRTVAEFGGLVIFIGVNAGIAHAQNVGIRTAKSHDAQWVLLLDQDSETTPGMIGKLRHALELRPDAAAAGPCSVDQRTGRRSIFVLDNGIWPRRCHLLPEQHEDAFEVGFLIASGCLLRISAVPDAAPMREDWFIDQVDSEWCFRIRTQGWVVLGVANATLLHRVGDKVTRLWFPPGRQIAHHSPLRHYYMFRNSILLARAKYVPWRWKLFFLSRLLQMAVFFLVFAPNRAQQTLMMGHGILDGLLGRTGPWK